LAAAAALLRSRRPERERAWQTLLLCALPPAFVLALNPMVLLTIALHPRVYDGFIRAFDVTLGIEPGLALARLVETVPPLGTVAGLVYAATPLGFAALYALERRSRSRAPIDVLAAFAVVSVAGFMLYHALPVVGPRYVFDHWGPELSALPELPLAPRLGPNVARNCMPSLHTAWALMIFWHTRGQARLVRAAAALFAGFTLLATLAFGLHYLIDLVVAVPFTLAAQGSVAPQSAARRVALIAGTAATALWLVALRTGILLRRPSAALSWTLVLLTVGIGLSLERRLWRASLDLTERES
jgi:hypothetical protein